MKSFETQLTWKFLLDANVFISFLGEGPYEFYSANTFPRHWESVICLIERGEIVSSRCVREEIRHKGRRGEDKQPKLEEFCRKYPRIFLEFGSDANLCWAKKIIQKFPGYALSENLANDLEVISQAATHNLCVVTLERSAEVASEKNPKIPDVCEEFNIPCLFLPKWFERERFPIEPISR